MAHYLTQFFEFRGLTKELAEIAQPYALLVQKILELCPENPERTTALRKLLESRECALRAKVFKTE